MSYTNSSKSSWFSSPSLTTNITNIKDELQALTNELNTLNPTEHEQELQNAPMALHAIIAQTMGILMNQNIARYDTQNNNVNSYVTGMQNQPNMQQHYGQPGQMMPGQMMPGQMMPGQMMPGQMGGGFMDSLGLGQGQGWGQSMMGQQGQPMMGQQGQPMMGQQGQPMMGQQGQPMMGQRQRSSSWGGSRKNKRGGGLLPASIDQTGGRRRKRRGSKRRGSKRRGSKRRG